MGKIKNGLKIPCLLETYRFDSDRRHHIFGVVPFRIIGL